MIFAQMLEIVALSDLASVLCARKFLFDPQGGFTRLRETSALCACCYLNYVYGLGMINEVSFNKKLGHLGQLNWASSKFDLSQRQETTPLCACSYFHLKKRKRSIKAGNGEIDIRWLYINETQLI